MTAGLWLVALRQSGNVCNVKNLAENKKTNYTISIELSQKCHSELVSESLKLDAEINSA